MRDLNKSWLLAHPLFLIAAAVLICLVPFLNKAAHIDDPLFLWSAEWIQHHPGDFYGFDVNWFSYSAPMFQTNLNPPLTSYYLALVGSLFGWNEKILHGAFLIIAIAAAAGVYYLARNWCKRPILAALIAIFTPVFLISSTTLMCDVFMLAFLLWALVVWENSLEKNSSFGLIVAGGLAGLAILTKYSAITFLPLLVLTGIIRKKKAGWWLVGLAMPVLMVGAYELITAKLYGQGLFSAAMHYASANRFVFPGGWTSKWLISLSFTGGCVLPAAFFAPWLWPRKQLLGGAFILFGSSLGVLSLMRHFGPMDLTTGPGTGFGFTLQSTFFIAAGLHLIILTVTETVRRRDAVSLILTFWIITGFLFATVLNWTVSARSLLPIVPPTAILVARRLEMMPQFAPRLGWPLAISAAIALCFVTVDYQLANSARNAAEIITAKFTATQNRLWFEGHWGFQYYVEKLGAIPVDFKESTLEAGDLLVVPSNNTNIKFLPSDTIEALGRLDLIPCSWASTMQSSVGAGFYAADWGPLPYAAGSVKLEAYYVFKISSTLHLRSKSKE